MITQKIKEIIKQTFLYDFLHDSSMHIHLTKEFKQWEKNGKPLPPPHSVKIKAVKEYAKEFSIETLIETGTYFGGMVDAAKRIFKNIYSIELDKPLCEQVKKRFSKFAHILIIWGDSGEVLPKILANIRKPCIFWLDAHYSGGITAKGDIESPILQELSHILEHSQEHIILIDDARLFVGQNDWPTIEDLKEFVKIYTNMVFEVKDDIIRIHKSTVNST